MAENARPSSVSARSMTKESQWTQATIANRRLKWMCCKVIATSSATRDNLPKSTITSQQTNNYPSIKVCLTRAKGNTTGRWLSSTDQTRWIYADLSRWVSSGIRAMNFPVSSKTWTKPLKVRLLPCQRLTSPYQLMRSTLSVIRTASTVRPLSTVSRAKLVR